MGFPRFSGDRMKLKMGDSLDKKLDTFTKLILVSRNVFNLSFVLLLSPGILLLLRNEWLRNILIGIFLIGAILMMVSWTTPAILILFGKPWFAWAWLQGRGGNWRSPKSWEILSSKEKKLLYFHSFLPFIFVIFGIILMIKRIEMNLN